jgi:hypothetical protein
LVPLKVSAAVPVFVNANAPLNAPFKMTGLSTVIVVADVITPVPLNVKAPFRVAFPKVKDPPI